MTEGPEIFDSILRAREERARRQLFILRRFERPIISVTVVSPGSDKCSPIIMKIFSEARKSICSTVKSSGSRVLLEEASVSSSGPEAIFVVSALSQIDIKKMTMLLEETHPLGRLWDLDVIAPDQFFLSRENFDFPARRCLLCSDIAMNCARSRKHSIEDLRREMKRIFFLFEKEKKN
ncbi:citrate lyase holo-[acyl-carrier protein] synthase [Gluconobacter kondonii]|uniref:citrate lyase holo-[acyl-carrier protein] synthase n=1 Tax=Gluconobacter kondonii TaxID=941463 RepID=UPI001982131E|nr:citrate lyase holo-[acyl-carrier protein] synthase [Gluconobacter kondonii]MBN3868404.1 citrate lyase holo-[acyl-carrier protein] synthase [Gluconobacter kondonii]